MSCDASHTLARRPWEFSSLALFRGRIRGTYKLSHTGAGRNCSISCQHLQQCTVQAIWTWERSDLLVRKATDNAEKARGSVSGAGSQFFSSAGKSNPVSL